jgi:hypothetical protein
MQPTTPGNLACSNPACKLASRLTHRLICVACERPTRLATDVHVKRQ